MGCVPCTNIQGSYTADNPDEPYDEQRYQDEFAQKEVVPRRAALLQQFGRDNALAADEARIYGGSVNTDAQDQADQQQALADQSSSVPNEAQARLGITACDACGDQRRLVNPQGGLAYQLEDVAVTQLAAPPAPALASADEAAEMVELYWQSLVRDVPFINWGSDPTIAAAISDLNARFKFYAGLPQFEIVPPGRTPRPEPRGFPTSR